MKSLIVFVSIFVLAACASESKTVGLGAALGGGTGALVGSIADPGKHGEFRTRNIILGTVLGGMAGAAAGSVIHNESEKSKKEAFLKGQASRPSQEGAPPNLSNPRVETKWIEGRALGNRFIEGHFEYVIIEPARWETSQ